MQSTMIRLSDRSQTLRVTPTGEPSPRLGGKEKKKLFQRIAQARGRCGTHQLGLARRQLQPEVQN
ncbi:unnamed protein product [Prunus armeniaca]